MEQELKENLRRIAEVYATTKDIKLSTVGREAAADGSFFERLADGKRSITARKYDDVMRWFSDNWPAGAAWPKGITRPMASSPPTVPSDSEPAAEERLP